MPKFKNDGMWLDKNVKEGLDQLRKAVDNKWDGVIIIDGMEGSGKTNLAFTSAYYLDPSFCLDNVVFTPEQFYEAVDKAEPGTAIVFDEFVTGGLSGDALTNITKALTKKMVMIRKKRLYIFLVIPYIYMLTKYFAIARTRFLFHCSTPDGIKRGYVKIFFRRSKNALYNKFRVTYQYDSSYDTYGRFCNFFSFKTPFSEDSYDKKKDDAIISLTGEEVQNDPIILKKYKDSFAILVKVLFYFGNFNRKQIADLVPLTANTVTRVMSSDVGDDVVDELRGKDGDV